MSNSQKVIWILFVVIIIALFVLYAFITEGITMIWLNNSIR